MNKHIIATISSLALILSPLVASAAPWAGPTGAPPTANKDAPINVSSATQHKPGVLEVNGLRAYVAAFFGTTAVGHNIGLASYSDGRSWNIRDDAGVNRLRFSRGSTDYTFWDVTKVAGSDSVSAQSWRVSDGNFSWDTGATTKMVLTNVGNVGIGLTNPSSKLEVAGDIEAQAFFYTSDKSLKSNISPLSGALENIKKLQGVSFTWKNSGDKALGLVAQDVEKVYPELVSTDPEGIKSVQYGNLVAPLIEAIKEQQKQIDALKAEVEALKSAN